MKGLNSINLINSMRVDRAEIKTRGNVMLIGDNDAGKTAALRLWIYFITGSREMLGLDARSHQDFADFYFPKSNSYVIYEMFNDDHCCMIILSCRNKVVCARFVDLPYRREYFFDDEDRAFVRWEDIADKIGPKAGDFAEVRGEENLRKIIYGNYDGPRSNDYRRFSLVRSRNADGLRRAVQGVFLNRDLVETRTIRDFILRSLNLYDAKVSITGLKKLIQPVKEQYNDILVWNHQTEDEGQVKLREAKDIISIYERKNEKDSTIAMSMAKLNYIPIRNKKYIDAINEVVKTRTFELDQVNRELAEREKNYPSCLEKYTKPIHDLENVIKRLDDQFKTYNSKEKKSVIDIFYHEDDILKTLEKLTLEYNALTTVTGDIDDKYTKMLQTVLMPMYELLEKWDGQIKAKEEKQRTEKLQSNIDYQSECNRIREEHASAVKRLSDEIRAKDNEIIDLNRQLLAIEKDNMFAERKAQIDAEMQKRSKKAASLVNDLTNLSKRLEEIKTACDKDISNLKVRMVTQWKAKEISLTTRQKDIASRIDGIDGSFLKFLENNKPGWEMTIGRLVDEETLFSHNLSPFIKDDSDSLYGIGINLEKIGKVPVNIDGLQKEMVDVEKELRKVRMFIDSPDVALQSEIAEIEEVFGKKAANVNKEVKSKEGLLNDENVQIENLKAELDGLLKKEKVTKDTKSRQVRERIDAVTLEKAGLDEALDTENGEKGYVKRLADAKIALEIRVKELEHYAQEISDLKEKVSNHKRDIQSEKDRIAAMKTKEMSERGVDTQRLASINNDIQELNKKKAVLDDKENIVMFGNYKRFLDEYTKRGSVQNQLSMARANKDSFIEEYDKKMSSLRSTRKSLENEIQRENGRQSSLTEEMNLAKKNLFEDDKDFCCPSYLVTSEIIENDEKAGGEGGLIKRIKRLIDDRKTLLDNLKIGIDLFVLPFSPNNVYKFKKLFNFNDPNLRDYCDFAQWLKEFVDNETWKEDERVSYIHFNDIIKEAGNEYQENENNMSRVETIVGKVNKDLRNLSFSKINFIEFNVEDSGNAVYKVLKEINTFYKENEDAIENNRMGIFALDISEAELDVLRQKAMELIFKLSLQLSNDSSSEISLKDTFEMEVTGQENGNTIPWTMSFTNFGSKGTSFVARTLINIVLIDVFKNNLESPQEFLIHCIMDEIGQLDTNNRKGILDFARARNICLIQAAPETMDGSDYDYVYYIETQNGKCRITKFIDV